MIELYNDDCLKIMEQLASKNIKVDAIITDPPYGTTSCKWDIVIPFDKMWEQVLKLCKDTTPIILFGTEPFSSLLRNSNLDYYKYDLYWVKEKPTNFFNLKKRFGKLTENICIFYKEQPTYNPQMVPSDKPLVKNKPKAKFNSQTTGNWNRTITPYNDTGYRYPCDLLYFNRVSLGKYIHPTQKPIELMEYLIKSFTNKNDLVLDFTMGSGTTGLACKKLDRDFIGIELDKEYFDIAKERIESYQNCKLF